MPARKTVSSGERCPDSLMAEHIYERFSEHVSHLTSRSSVAADTISVIT